MRTYGRKKAQNWGGFNAGMEPVKGEARRWNREAAEEGLREYDEARWDSAATEDDSSRACVSGSDDSTPQRCLTVQISDTQD